jgi:hypothetical protein
MMCLRVSRYLIDVAAARYRLFNDVNFAAAGTKGEPLKGGEDGRARGTWNRDFW